MLFPALAQHATKLKFLLNENSQTVLTAVSVSGTVMTAYLSGRASFKAADIIEHEELKRASDARMEKLRTAGVESITPEELTNKEKVKLVWPSYIPAVTVGALTITSIIVANRISSRKIAALAVASGISERALQEYKAKVVEKLGERQDQKIRDEVAQDRVNKNPPSSQVVVTGDGQVLCFDMLTGRYFQSSMEDIKRAENKINYQLVHFMHASLTEFYDEIGLPPTSYTDSVGWNLNHRMEIDFTTTMSPDNRPCLAIDFKNPPTANYTDLHD